MKPAPANGRSFAVRPNRPAEPKVGEGVEATKLASRRLRQVPKGNVETVPHTHLGRGVRGGGIPPNRDGAPGRHIASVPGAVTDDSTGPAGSEH